MLKKSLIGIIFILCLCSYFSLGYAQGELTSEKRVELAKNFLAKDNASAALNVLQPKPISVEPSYDVLILTAQSYAMLDNPMLALMYYNAALNIAKAPDERQVAYFGIAKMQFWLGHYVRAETTYRDLLTEHLNRKDYELALAGLIKSLAYQDKTRLAYSYVPEDMVFTTPEMVIAASQASLWSDWGDITRDILTEYQPITQKLDPWSPLGGDFRDLQWQTALATSPNTLTPTFFYSGDSDGFIKRHSTLNYRRYWSQIFQTSVGVDHFLYTQNNLPPNKGSLNAYGVYLGQAWRPTRTLMFEGQVEPTDYDQWHPVLWSARGVYRPNDIMGVELLGFREIVETFPAFDNQIADNNYSAGLLLHPVPYVQLNGSLNTLQFNDSNRRNGYYLSGELLVFPDFGLSTILITRGFTDKFKSPNYFSPERYTARTAILRLSRKINTTWDYYIDGGLGQQTIKPDEFTRSGSSPTHQWGVGINGPIMSWITLNAYYAQTNQAAAFTDSPNYRYQYAGVSLNFLF